MTMLNINNIVRRIIAEEFNDEIEPNKLIEIDERTFTINDIYENMSRIDLKLAHKELSKIKNLYPNSRFNVSGNYIVIEIFVRFYTLIIEIHKTEGNIFYIKVTKNM